MQTGQTCANCKLESSEFGVRSLRSRLPTSQFAVCACLPCLHVLPPLPTLPSLPVPPRLVQPPEDAGDGGAGYDAMSYGLLHEYLGRNCSSLRSIVTAHDMVLFALWRWANEEQQARWLEPLLSGKMLAAFAMS